MTNILHDSTRSPFALPTRHPKWRDVVSHQGSLDEILDINPAVVDTSEIQRAPMHYAWAGEHHPLNIHAGDGKVIRAAGGGWDLQLEAQPNVDDVDGGGGLPFISFHTNNYLAHERCVLTITSGEARVLAAQLTAAADKIDLS